MPPGSRGSETALSQSLRPCLIAPRGDELVATRACVHARRPPERRPRPGRLARVSDRRAVHPEHRRYVNDREAAAKALPAEKLDVLASPRRPCRQPFAAGNAPLKLSPGSGSGDGRGNGIYFPTGFPRSPLNNSRTCRSSFFSKYFFVLASSSSQYLACCAASGCSDRRHQSESDPFARRVPVSTLGKIRIPQLTETAELVPCGGSAIGKLRPGRSRRVRCAGTLHRPDHRVLGADRPRPRYELRVQFLVILTATISATLPCMSYRPHGLGFFRADLAGTRARRPSTRSCR